MRTGASKAIRGTAAAVTVLAASLAAGCGGSGDQAAPATITQPAETPGPANEVPRQGDITVLDCDHRARIRPAEINYACADNNGRVTRIIWTSWDTSHASGKATHHHNLCEPDCASGKFQDDPVLIELTSVRDGRFTDMVLTDPAGTPSTVPLWAS